MIKVLRQILLDSAEVRALVGDRVHIEVAPAKPVSPYIVYNIVDEVDGQSLRGRTGRIEERVQVNCWSASAIQAWDLAALVTTAMVAVRGVYGELQIQVVRSDGRRNISQDPDGGQNTGAHGVAADFIVSFSAAE